MHTDNVMSKIPHLVIFSESRSPIALSGTYNHVCSAPPSRGQRRRVEDTTADPHTAPETRVRIPTKSQKENEKGEFDRPWSARTQAEYFANVLTFILL